jgi:flagellin
MAIVVQSNIESMFAQNQMSKTAINMGKTFNRLSSGFRLNDASDDAAGLGISKSMNAQVRSYVVAERNANDAISMLQTADGGAEQVHELLTRMRELAVQASNGSLSADDYTNLNTEYTSVLAEVDRVASSTSFNGIGLLQGAAATRDFQVGIGTAATDRITVSFGGAGATQLAVNATDVTNFANAQTSITALDTAIQSLSTVREGFGAAMNRMSTAVGNLQTMQTNTASSLSRIRDVDVASEATKLSRFQVLSQAGASVLAQANQAPQLALQLLRG